MLYYVTAGESKALYCGMHLTRNFIITFFTKVYMFNSLMRCFNPVILT